MMKKTTILLFGLLTLAACDNPEEIKTEASIINNEQVKQDNTEFLTNTYINEELGFSINYPTTWSMRDFEKSDAMDGVTNLSFANSQDEFDNIYEKPEGYQSVGITIYEIESENHDNGYRNHFLTNLDYNERFKNAELTTYEVGGGELELYIHETEGSSDTLPILMTEGFYKGEIYAYSLRIDQEDYTNKEEGRVIIEEYLKPMLSTFEDLGGVKMVDPNPEPDVFEGNNVTVQTEKDNVTPPKEAFIFIPNLDSLSPAENGAYYIYGTTSDNCERIVVEASNPSGYVDDVYELENYNLGDTTFKYGIRDDWNNLALGSNTYTFTVYCEGGQIKEYTEAFNYTVRPTYTYPSETSGSIDFIESHIDGDFEGWDGDTIFQLSNGQIWQQDSYDYIYHYAYRPEVIIYKNGLFYEMQVEDIDETIRVKRLD